MDDWQQLREYMANGSEAAFSSLVNRHLGLVYSVALRKLGNPEDAKEVAQSVFCDLARKARKLRPKTNIAGWLHQAAWIAALSYRRDDYRRRQREQQAALMNTSDPAIEYSWPQVAASLDEALSQMNEQERLGVLLRYFQNKSFRQVGEALGVNEDAARMRVNRALEKLHALLIRKGVSCSLSVLGALLAEQAVQAVPLEIVQSVLNAWRQAAQAPPAPTTLPQWVNLLTKIKLKTVLIFGLALLVTVDAGLFVLNHFQKQSAQTTNPNSLPDRRTVVKQIGSSRRPTTKPQPRMSDLDRAIANLRRVLREEGLDENGRYDYYIVYRATDAFGTNIAAAIPVLLEGLRDPDFRVSTLSNMGLGWLGVRAVEAVPALLDLCRPRTESRQTRTQAMGALVGILRKCESMRADDPAIAAAVPTLIGLLKSDDYEVARQTAFGLAFLKAGANQAIPQIAELLTYSVSSQQAEAELKRRLGAASEPGAAKIEHEKQRLTAFVRESAARALEIMGPAAATAVPDIIKRLDDSDKYVRVQSAIAVWKITGRTDMAGALAADIVAVASDEPDHLPEALGALGEMGSAAKVAVPSLQELCRSPDPKIGPWALRNLQKIDPEAAAKVRPLPEWEPKAGN